MAENEEEIIITAKNRKKSLRRAALTQMGLLLLALAAINIIGNLLFARVDLTSDKRYTLSPATHKMLKNLDGLVSITVYLEGEDLRPDLARLNRSTRDMLDELRSIAGDKIQYQFINPDKLDPETRKSLFEQLFRVGLPPMVIEDRATGQVTEKRIVPGAIVRMGDKEMGVQLYQQATVLNGQDMSLENAVIGLEYGFVDAIHKLQEGQKRKLAFLRGNGEARPIEVADIYGTLKQTYDVDFVNLNESMVGRLNEYAAVIIAKPDSTFTELQKYIIDQYIMQGGRVLWCLDMLNASMDSLRHSGSSITTDYNLNLSNDMLFNYGVRMNPDLVQDANCNVIPLVNRGGTGGKFVPSPWPFYPVVNTPSGSGHPIVNNLNPIWFQFAGSIDTLSGQRNRQVKKTVLLTSSTATRVSQNPVNISLGASFNFRRDLAAGLFNQGPKNLAVLLEGSFRTAFFNRRPTAETLSSGKYGDFLEESKPTRMIVISDGDIIKNDVNLSQGQPYRLGFDRYTQQFFGNKNFVLNCVDYLVDENNMLSLRSKDLRVRPLDAKKVEAEKSRLQLQNIFLPLVLISVFGIGYNYIRRRRFA